MINEKDRVRHSRHILSMCEVHFPRLVFLSLVTLYSLGIERAGELQLADELQRAIRPAVHYSHSQRGEKTTFEAW